MPRNFPRKIAYFLGSLIRSWVRKGQKRGNFFFFVRNETERAGKLVENHSQSQKGKPVVKLLSKQALEEKARPRGRPTKQYLENAGMIPKFQDPGGRAKDLISRHSSEKILRALNDEKYLTQEFSTYDGMIIVWLAQALKGDGVEREKLFNRMFGKVADKQVNVNVNVEATPESLSNKARELLSRIG